MAFAVDRSLPGTHSPENYAPAHRALLTEEQATTRVPIFLLLQFDCQLSLSIFILSLSSCFHFLCSLSLLNISSRYIFNNYTINFHFLFLLLPFNFFLSLTVWKIMLLPIQWARTRGSESSFSIFNLIVNSHFFFSLSLVVDFFSLSLFTFSIQPIFSESLLYLYLLFSSPLFTFTVHFSIFCFTFSLHVLFSLSPFDSFFTHSLENYAVTHPVDKNKRVASFSSSF